MNNSPFTPKKPEPSLRDLAAMQAQDVRRHYQGVETAVLIPALQSMLLSLGISGLAAVVGYALQWRYTFHATVGIFFLVFVLYLWARFTDWSNLVWHIEEVLNADLTGDQVIGEPRDIRLNVVSDGGKRQQFLDLIGKESSIIDFLAALVEDGTVTVRDWAGDGKPFSRTEFDHNRQKLLDANMLEWVSEKDRRQGVKLSEHGAAALKDVLFDTSPTP